MNPSSPGVEDKKDGLIPDAVRHILASGEEVEVRYQMKAAEAYATATRLIIFREGRTSSHEYRHIAAAREIARTNAWLILAGVALFALGGTSTIFPVAGAGLILLGIFTRARRVELLVTGIKEPIILDGAREVLGPLVQRLTDRGSRRLSG